MSTERWKVNRWAIPNPKCIFCDSITESMIIFQIEENIIRGWKCPKCGFALIHPDEIPKAMELLKESMKLRT